MNSDTVGRQPKRSTARTAATIYEFFVVTLFLSYGLAVVAAHEGHPAITTDMLLAIDRFVLAFLAVEFVFRLWRATDRTRFLRGNWFDLVALIPVDPSFRLARLFHVVRLYRLVRSSPVLWKFFSSRETFYILLFAALIVLWSSTGVYLFEKGVNPNIDDYGDAVWWSIVTMSTVGYGDISPQTAGERAIAVFLMVSGIGILGAITANLANLWIKRGAEAGPTDALQDLKAKLHEWTDRLEALSEAEYEAMLRTMETVRTAGRFAGGRRWGSVPADEARVDTAQGE